jgi:hypothetical protein
LELLEVQVVVDLTHKQLELVTKAVIHQLKDLLVDQAMHLTLEVVEVEELLKQEHKRLLTTERLVEMDNLHL